MAPSLRRDLPLIYILQKLSPRDRQVLISHLSDNSCKSVEACIARVLKGKKKLTPALRARLSKCIKKHHKHFDRIASARTITGKRKALARVGGGIFTLLFGVGLPLLLSLIPTK